MNATVLIVDDNECIRELLYMYLAGAGYRVLTAENAIVADRVLRSHRVDLLLVDIEMPILNGLGLVQALRNHETLSTLPVVFVTAHEGYERRARELGAVAFLKKPVRTSQLFSTVAEHTAGRPQLAR